MSNNSFLGYGLALVVGVVAGFIAPGAGFAWLWAFSGFGLTAALLVRPPLPTLDSKPTDYGNAGRQQNSRQAAAEALNMNSASEALVIPVAFGTVRVNANHIRYDESTFRSVPIIERQERSPQAVAYAIAKEQFEQNPAVVDHEIDRAARKKSGVTGGKKGGGKGGGGKVPPPSKGYTDLEKVSAYTQVLLDNDESGKAKLPKEYDEVVIGFNYYLSFEVGLCEGTVSALHGVLSYPGEKYVIDRREDPYIVADHTTLTAAGATEGGLVRFYRGSGTQTRNPADVYDEDDASYKGTCFAVFEDYKMGPTPAPNSFSFEIERIPVCLDENGDPVADFELRAGDDTLPVDVTVAVWEANVLTLTAPGHEITPGAVFFLKDFDPDGFNGQYTASTVVGDVVTAALVIEPPQATTFGEVQGPPHGATTDIDDEEWAGGLATFTVPGHGLTVGQLTEITNYTSTDWNGTWTVALIDGDDFSVSMPDDPGPATGTGHFRAYPQPSQITAVNWEAGVATFDASNDFEDGDGVIVSGMNPAIYNGQFAVIDADGSTFDVALVSPPAPATTMGTAIGPATATPRTIGHIESWVGGVVTFDLSGPESTGYSVGSKVLVEGCTPSGYNGLFTVTNIDGDQWSAALATDPGPLTVAGTATLQPAAKPVQTVSWESGVATFLILAHGYSTGDEVTIADMLPVGYNGTFTITDTDGPDQFSVAIVADPGAVQTLGSIRLRPAAAYGDANPAAVLYEMLTNAVWGRGLSPERIDIASFVSASQYYKAEGVGMSFTLESQGSLSDAIETLRACVNLAIYWSGFKLYCRALNDRDNAYSPRIVITRDSVKDPDFSRPAWPSTFNEVRVQFLNRYNNYGTEIATVHDDANFAVTQQPNSTKVDLPAISSRETATLIAQRLMTDLSYPQATLKFRMSRVHSSLYPTAFVEFQWPDWSDGTVTTYWRVQSLDDNDQSEDGIMVTLAEDVYSTPVPGIPESFTAPVPAFEGMTRNSDADLYLTTNKATTPDLTGMFFMVAEMPISLTEGDRMFAFMAQRKDGYVQSVSLFAKPQGSGDDYALLGNVKPWAIAGVLKTALSATGPRMSRSASFTVQLRYASERAKFLSACSVLPTTSDSIQVLTGSEQNWLVIDNEFIEVGQAEAGTAPNEVIITAYIRGMYGSEQVAHTAGTGTMFALNFIPYAHTLRYDQLPVNVPIAFRAIALDRAGRMGTPVDFVYTLTGLALKALRVHTAFGEIDGTDWQINYRPRWHNRGADIYSDLTSMLNTLAGEIPTGYETRAVPLDSQGAPLLEVPRLMDVDYTPSNPAGNDAATGMVAFTYEDVPAEAVVLRLQQTFNGVLGLPCDIRLLPNIDSGGGGDGDPTILRIDVDASDLPALSGIFGWQDRDETDGQDNSASINWSYSTTFGDPKPTLVGGTHLSGLVNAYPPSINFPMTPLGLTPDFEMSIDCTPGGTWSDPGIFGYIGKVCIVNFGGGSFLEIGFLGTGTNGLQMYAWCNPHAAVYEPITAGVRQTLRVRLTNPSAGAFDMEIYIDGVLASTTGISFDLPEIQDAKLTVLTTSGASFTMTLDLYAFNVSTL